jgi:PAS domain S-box-containing protein
MSGLRESDAAPVDADEHAQEASFMRLVALEAEAAKLRLELGTGLRPKLCEVTPAMSIFSLFERYATDFLSVHAADGTYLYASPSCERLFGHTPASLIGRSAYDFFHPEDLDRVARNHVEHLLPGPPPPIEYRLRRADGSFVWVESRTDASYAEGGVQEIIAVTRDITERREASEAQARLIKELEHRIEQVRMLSGLLPICAWCKSVRDDDGYWHQVDAYLEKRGHFEFTHGACPTCAATIRATTIKPP